MKLISSLLIISMLCLLVMTAIPEIIEPVYTYSMGEMLSRDIKLYENDKYLISADITKWDKDIKIKEKPVVSVWIPRGIFAGLALLNWNKPDFISFVSGSVFMVLAFTYEF